MTFAELIKKYDWEAVQGTLLLLYEDEQKNLAGYAKAYKELQSTEPSSSEYTIHIELVRDDGDYENVYALRPADTAHYGLDFVLWSEVLASKIGSKTLKKYSELHILVHILYEITYYGYSSAEVGAKGLEFQHTAWEALTDK